MSLLCKIGIHKMKPLPPEEVEKHAPLFIFPGVWHKCERCGKEENMYMR